MFDIKWIRLSPELFDRGLKRRGLEPLSHKVLDLDAKHRQVLTDLQNLQSERNSIAKEFGKIKQQGGDTSALTARSDSIKKDMSDLEQTSNILEQQINDLLSSLPNTPADDCPDGKDEHDNVEVRLVGTLRTFDFTPKQHFELGEELGQMDFERATKLSGSRFVVLHKDLARLERALASFMIDSHTSEFGYEEAYVPLLVNDNAVYGVGQLPKFKEDLFQTTTGHWLISTSEVSLTNLVSDEILNEESLPLRFTAYTPCFRSEAGAAGRDTRGMIRQHQFSKVELVSITTPEQAEQEHERMLSAAETILKKLELPYRVMALCTGDMGFQSEKTYDLEVWLPGQNAYREISSCSRCNTFQARRMNARYRSKNGDKPAFVHTLNGSGLAIGRTMVAILENYQEKDGSIKIPDVLVPYMGGKRKIEKKP